MEKKNCEDLSSNWNGYREMNNVLDIRYSIENLHITL